MKTNAFPVDAVCFIEIVHDKWRLDNSLGQTDALERDFVKHGLNSV